MLSRVLSRVCQNWKGCISLVEKSKKSADIAVGQKKTDVILFTDFPGFKALFVRLNDIS